MITAYQEQRRTIVNHQQELRLYLGVSRFSEGELGALETYLFDEACRLEQTGLLLTQAKRFLNEHSILYPSDEVLRRLVVKQRQAARDHIYERIALTFAKQQALLMVLDHPDIPLHNNAAELAARTRVRKRKISYGTRSDDGTRAWDTLRAEPQDEAFMTLSQTAKKLNVSFYHYIHDRISAASPVSPT